MRILSPDYWDINKADLGDTVVCPKCGINQEKSEVV